MDYPLKRETNPIYGYFMKIWIYQIQCMCKFRILLIRTGKPLLNRKLLYFLKLVALIASTSFLSCLLMYLRNDKIFEIFFSPYNWRYFVNSPMK